MYDGTFGCLGMFGRPAMIHAARMATGDYNYVPYVWLPATICAARIITGLPNDRNGQYEWLSILGHIRAQVVAT